MNVLYPGDRKRASHEDLDDTTDKFKRVKVSDTEPEPAVMKVVISTKTLTPVNEYEKEAVQDRYKHINSLLNNLHKQHHGKD
jgi:hypothetical protein